MFLKRLTEMKSLKSFNYLVLAFIAIQFLLINQLLAQQQVATTKLPTKAKVPACNKKDEKSVTTTLQPIVIPGTTQSKMPALGSPGFGPGTNPGRQENPPAPTATPRPPCDPRVRHCPTGNTPGGGSQGRQDPNINTNPGASQDPSPSADGNGQNGSGTSGNKPGPGTGNAPATSKPGQSGTAPAQAASNNQQNKQIPASQPNTAAGGWDGMFPSANRPGAEGNNSPASQNFYNQYYQYYGSDDDAEGEWSPPSNDGRVPDESDSPGNPDDGSEGDQDEGGVDPSPGLPGADVGCWLGGEKEEHYFTKDGKRYLKSAPGQHCLPRLKLGCRNPDDRGACYEVKHLNPQFGCAGLRGRASCEGGDRPLFAPPNGSVAQPMLVNVP